MCDYTDDADLVFEISAIQSCGWSRFTPISAINTVLIAFGKRHSS
jgi:hypothetical protein